VVGRDRVEVVADTAGADIEVVAVVEVADTEVAVLVAVKLQQD